MNLEGGTVVPDRHPSPARDPGHEFAVHSRSDPTGAVVLEVVGDVDLQTASSLLEAAETTLDARCRVLVVDLAGMTFCSARCIETLVEVRRLARQHGATVRFTNPSHQVLRVASLCRSRDVLEDEAPCGSS